MIRQMKEEFADAMKQKDAIIAVRIGVDALGVGESAAVYCGSETE